VCGVYVCKPFRVVAFALLHLTPARTHAFSSTSYEVSVQRDVTHSLTQIKYILSMEIRILFY